MLAEFTLIWWNAIYVLNRPWPDWVSSRDKFGNKILKLSRMIVVGHQPHADPWFALNYRALGIKCIRGLHTGSAQLVGDGLPSSTDVVIGICHDAHCLPAGSFDLQWDRFQEIVDSVFVKAFKRQCRCQTFVEVKNNMLVIDPLHKKHLWC